MKVVLIAEKLSKQYRLGVMGHGMLYKDMQSWWARLRGRPDPNAIFVGTEAEKARRGDRIWALRDVSLQVKEGEVLGIIGKNGAGKSTLLKIISRVTSPTKGTIKIKGRVASLLEVGTGFHPELTGRENVHLNGAILGMTGSEISRKFDEIVDFSGVEEFIDTPVKRYSSGMHVRLAFAVAAHLDPDILVVDEVLAVGDAEFQRKCLAKMGSMTGGGRTILFVSHNMTAIRTLCSRAILLDRGAIATEGDPGHVIGQYLEGKTYDGAVVSAEEYERRMDSCYFQGVVFFKCLEVALLDETDTPRNVFRSSEDITLAITFECFQTTPHLQIGFSLVDRDDVPILRSEFADDPVSRSYYSFDPGVYRVRCKIPRNLFGERRFFMTVGFTCQNVQHLVAKQLLQIDMEFLGYEDNLSPHSKEAYFRPKLEWKLDELSTS